ncbi:hypothetical protein F132_6 [Flavobacterium sp. phage 1/32]|nr:hypothetical protein F132_6 [Flavobacterium sp. phage 1/32]
MNLEEQKGTSVLVEIIGKQGKEIEELTNTKKSYWDWYEREKKDKEALELELEKVKKSFDPMEDKINLLSNEKNLLLTFAQKVNESLEGTKNKSFLEIQEKAKEIVKRCTNE